MDNPSLDETGKKWTDLTDTVSHRNLKVNFIKTEK